MGTQVNAALGAVQGASILSSSAAATSASDWLLAPLVSAGMRFAGADKLVGDAKTVWTGEPSNYLSAQLYNVLSDRPVEEGNAIFNAVTGAFMPANRLSTAIPKGGMQIWPYGGATETTRYTLGNQPLKGVTPYQVPHSMSESGNPEYILIRKGKDVNVDVIAKSKQNGEVFFDTNQRARPSYLADANKKTLISDTVENGAAKKDLSTPPNRDMSSAHAEVGVLQQMENKAMLKGQDILLDVFGKNLCSFCRSDVKNFASKADANLLKVRTTQGDKKRMFLWENGMKKWTVNNAKIEE